LFRDRLRLITLEFGAMIKMEEILDMSVDDRLVMIGKIWDSLDHGNINTSPAQEQELDRRLARYEHGETEFFSWEEVKKELNSAK
jgi:putative addiction module component (TIGR02574 family)